MGSAEITVMNFRRLFRVVQRECGAPAERSEDRVPPRVRLDLKFLLIKRPIVLKPAVCMLAIRVAMSPMNDATLRIPLVHSVELDFIA